jgi:autonomous glycyl radical cofactor GrcA
MKHKLTITLGLVVDCDNLALEQVVATRHAGISDARTIQIEMRPEIKAETRIVP